MAKQYHTLVVLNKESNQYYIAFGDFHLSVVMQELRDSYEEEYEADHFKVLVTAEHQCSIDDALDSLNALNALNADMERTWTVYASDPVHPHPRNRIAQVLVGSQVQVMHYLNDYISQQIVQAQAKWAELNVDSREELNDMNDPFNPALTSKVDFDNCECDPDECAPGAMGVWAGPAASLKVEV